MWSDVVRFSTFGMVLKLPYNLTNPCSVKRNSEAKVRSPGGDDVQDILFGITD
jgi:hypothetical protein